MPAGLPYKKVEVLVQGFRLAKTRFKAVGEEGQLFAKCFTVGTLVEKLEQTFQTRCCHYLAEQPDEAPQEVF